MPQTFKTSAPTLAAVLLVNGCRFIKAKKSSGRQVYIFENDAAIGLLAENFEEDFFMARRYSQALRQLSCLTTKIKKVL